MAFPTNTTPPWKSYMATGNTADIVASTTVASAIGAKVDATNGQSLNQTLQSPTITGSGSAITLEPSVSTNNTVGISWNGVWDMSLDPFSTGANDMTIYHKTTNNLVMRLLEDDQIVTNFFTYKKNNSAFDGSGASINVNAFFGDPSGPNAPTDSAIASSGSGLSVVSNIYDVEEAAQSGLNFQTYSELTCIYTFLQYFSQFEQKFTHAIGYDNHYMGPHTTDATLRPEIVLGMSYYGNNYSTGSELRDANGRGSFMYSACTTPQPDSTLEYYGIAAGTESTPYTAMFAACGWSGANTFVGGDNSVAKPAATYAFLAGSGGGSVYLPAYNTRSRFTYGAGLGDWTDVGLNILAPTGSPTESSNPQIGINNAWLTQLGGQPSDDTAVMLSLMPDSRTDKNNAASKKCSVYWGGQWLVGTDSQAGGGSDFFFFSEAAGKIVLQLDTDKIGFFGATPVVQPTMTELSDSATLADCISAFNQMAASLKSLGLVSVTTS